MSGLNGTMGLGIRQRKIAFDRGGVLDTSRVAVELAELLSMFTECYCISAVQAEDHDTVESLTQKYMTTYPHLIEELYRKVPQLRGVYFTPAYDLGKTEEDTAYDAGIEKARLMKELGVTGLVDDNSHVCRAVRDQGLTALWLCEKQEG